MCPGGGLFPDAGCLHTARLAAEKVASGQLGAGLVVGVVRIRIGFVEYSVFKK